MYIWQMKAERPRELGLGAGGQLTGSHPVPNAHPALMSPGEVRDTRASFHGTRRLGRTIAKFKTL